MRLLKILGPLAISLLSACGGDSGQNSGGQGGAGATSSTGGTAGSGGSAGSAGAGGSAGAAVGVCPTGHPLGAVARKPTVQVKFGDKGPFEFVYDTGAPTSVMDTATFKQIGQGPYEIHVADKTIPLGYMTTTSIAQYGIPGIDGILGADVMGGHSVTLDVKRGVFWMEAARDESDLLACDHVEKNPVDVPYVYQHYFFVPGKAEGLEGWFLVDSGASLGAMPSGVFDTLQAKAPRPAIGGFYTPAGIGTFWAQLTTIGSLEVAGRAIKNITTRTIPEGMIPLPQLEGGPFLGVLPNGYLSHFLVTIDQPAGVIRMDGYAGMSTTEPQEFFPYGVALEETTSGPVKVAAVMAGSSAKDMGVQVGDEITVAAGKPMSSYSPAQRPWLFTGRYIGEVLNISVSRGGQPLDFKLEARDILTAPKLGD